MNIQGLGPIIIDTAMAVAPWTRAPWVCNIPTCSYLEREQTSSRQMLQAPPLKYLNYQLAEDRRDFGKLDTHNFL